MNNLLKLVVSFGLLIPSASLSNATEYVTSPDGRISLSVGLKSGKPYYTVNYNQTPIIAPSHLGFRLDKGTLGENMRMVGKYVTVARKERLRVGDGTSGMRGGDRWFIGSITNEEARQIDLSLDFLDKGTTYRAVIYEDGPDADYEKNPYPMTIRQEEVTSESTLHLSLARSGGAAIRIEKLKD